MVHEHIVHFLRGNFFPAAIDHLLDAAGDEHVAGTIHKPLVTGPKPPMREGMLVRQWIVVIPLHDAGATHNDLTGFSCWQQGASLVHNGHLRSSCHPNRTDLVRTWRQRITGYRGALRHAVGLDHRGVE